MFLSKSFTLSSKKYAFPLRIVNSRRFEVSRLLKAT